VKIRTWDDMLRQGFKNVFRNRVMSLASISAITAALFVLGLVLAVVMNLNNIVSGLESKVEITVFLKQDTQYNDIQAMEQQIKAWNGISEYEYISKAEALETWRREWGDKRYLLDGYNSENNPLPDSFLIRVEKPEFVEGIVEKAKGFKAAEKVQYSKDVVDSISNIASTTRLIGIIIVILLITMAMVIIHNTIRISVYSRRREINIMKYIGATDWYIRWPFLIEGMVLGLFGALVSGGLTAGVYSLLLKRLNGSQIQNNFLSMLQLLPLKNIIYQIIGLFLLTGSIVGITASILSLRKHLRV
jgi:cell division transport system permease protein